jgi:predicted small lipoprotein YifL
MQYLYRTILMIPALALALSLAGCGQKGDLYVEDGDAAPSSQEAETQAEEQDGEDDGD